MAIRTILTQDDPALNKVCHPVTRFDDKLADLLDDLKETLTQANGMGLAAPQVGILRRAAIVLLEDESMLEMVNPEILDQRGEQPGWEGCLSLPGMWGNVMRPDWVKIRAQDRNGQWFEMEGTDMTARCFCHEISHLDGHMYTELTERLYTAEELDEMLDDLKETLSDANGAGLAAPQIGILRRAVIVVPDPELDEMIELVNPELLAQEGEQANHPKRERRGRRRR